MSAESLAILGQLVATVLLILVNSLYVFHEFAFVTLKPARVKQLERGGSWIGRLVARGAHHLDHYIAVDQLGITASSIAVGWIGQPLIALLLIPPFAALGFLGPVAAPAVAAAAAFVLLIGTQMIVGELIPKTIALRNPERVAQLVALPVELSAFVFHPLVAVLNGLGNLTARVFGVTPQAESHSHELPAEELAVVIEASSRAGVLTADARALRLALRFSDIRARDLMTPRQDVVALNVRLSTAEVLAVARQAHHTRFPVFDRTIDEVVGLLNVKDLVQAQPSGRMGFVADWRRLIRPIPTLPEIASVEQVLYRLAQEKQHLALLVDEYGGTAGILTVTDVAAQIIGEPEDVQSLADGSILLRGEASVSAVEATLGISLGPEEREYETIAGLLMDRLGRIPSTGDRVEVDGYELTVTTMRGRRVTRVALRLPEAREAVADGEATPPPEA